MGIYKEENVFEITELQKKFNAVKPQEGQHLHIVKNYPKFSKYLQSTCEHEIWGYIHSVAQFYIQRYAQYAEENRKGSAKFWHQSNTSKLMFFRLLERTALVIGKGKIEYGMPQNELVAFIKASCGASSRTVTELCTTAIEAGYLETTPWWKDKRVTIVYLSPLSIAEYVEYGIMRHYWSAHGAGMSAANQRLEAALAETRDDQFEFKFMKLATEGS